MRWCHRLGTTNIQGCRQGKRIPHRGPVCLFHTQHSLSKYGSNYVSQVRWAGASNLRQRELEFLGRGAGPCKANTATQSARSQRSQLQHPSASSNTEQFLMFFLCVFLRVRTVCRPCHRFQTLASCQSSCAWQAVRFGLHTADSLNTRTISEIENTRS